MESPGTTLMQIMADLLRSAPADEAPVMAWPAICGGAISARTRALRYLGGTLSVEVPDRIWQNQLAQLQAGYLQAFAAMLGKDRVHKIEFVVPGTGQETRNAKREM